ncbi:MAG TPA: hypothetical protein EYN69_13305 [Flavobacteriales bacterium]|nr:hypothetical protein [Flavobacteriales bacterium]
MKDLRIPHNYNDPLATPLSFDVSSLSTAICPVRVMLSKHAEVITLLPNSVTQERGSVVHGVLKERDTSSLDAIECRQLIDEIVSRRCYPKTNPNSVMVGDRFEQFFSLSEWNKRASWILKLNTEQYNYPKFVRRSSTSNRQGSLDREILEDQLPSPGPEAWVASRKLKLKGKIDQVVMDPDGSWQLIEYKTRNIFTPDGQFCESTKAQLLFYALIVRQLSPNDSIKLIAYGRESIPFEFAFDSKAELEAKELYERQVALFPSDSTICVQRDAKPSSECKSCQSRPCCPAYHDWAQQCWGDEEKSDDCPLDTWGVVTDVRSVNGYPNGLVYLEDATGRNVLLRYLHPQVVKEPLISGMKIWCYEMKTDARSKLHPRDFFHHRQDPKKVYESAVASRIYYSV